MKRLVSMVRIDCLRSLASVPNIEKVLTEDEVLNHVRQFKFWPDGMSWEQKSGTSYSHSIEISSTALYHISTKINLDNNSIATQRGNDPVIKHMYHQVRAANDTISISQTAEDWIGQILKSQILKSYHSLKLLTFNRCHRTPTR